MAQNELYNANKIFSTSPHNHTSFITYILFSVRKNLQSLRENELKDLKYEIEKTLMR